MADAPEQPIETAPRDGTAILGIFQGEGQPVATQYVMHYSRHHAAWKIGTSDERGAALIGPNYIQPKAWVPLEPPEVRTENDIPRTLVPGAPHPGKNDAESGA